MAVPVHWQSANPVAIFNAPSTGQPRLAPARRPALACDQRKHKVHEPAPGSARPEDRVHCRLRPLPAADPRRFLGLLIMVLMPLAGDHHDGIQPTLVIDRRVRPKSDGPSRPGGSKAQGAAWAWCVCNVTVSLGLWAPGRGSRLEAGLHGSVRSRVDWGMKLLVPNSDLPTWTAVDLAASEAGPSKFGVGPGPGGGGGGSLKVQTRPD